MLRAEAWVVVVASYALPALAYLWPQDYRNESAMYVLVAWAAFLVRVLQFHLGLLLAVIVLAATMRRLKRLALAALPPLLVALAPAAASFLPRSAPPAAPSSPVLRVMSCNLLTINQDTEGILDEVKRARPDVLLLQEYSAHWHAAASAALAKEYPYRRGVVREDAFGVAIYSRLPFVGYVDDRVPLGRVGVEEMRAVVRFGGSEVAVYNVHLLPPRSLEYTIEGRLQFAGLLDTLRAERLPYLLAGDLNLTNDTPQHRDLRRAGARDVHDLVGRGRGATWPVNSFFRYLPGIRLDHVYVGPGLTPLRATIGVGRGSDHRPVIADLAWTAR